MFTGIVRGVGVVREMVSQGEGDLRLSLDAPPGTLGSLAEGDSVSVSGVCLTALQIGPGGFSADVSRETLRLTTLGRLRAGARVNLEPALRVGDALGGHWVTGHVDGVASVVELAADARSLRVLLRTDPRWMRYIAAKGSVTLDGVSLTVNTAGPTDFSVNLIPHTREVTTLGELAVGGTLNLEIDALARYVERLMSPASAA